MNEQSDAWSVSRPLKVGLIALIILVGGFGSWSAFTTLSGAVVASGQIVVDRNRQAIQHPEGGLVAQLMVEEGDRVESAEILARLDPSRLQAERAVLQANLWELQARRARVEAERDGAQDVTFDANLRTMAAGNADIADLISGQHNLFSVRLEAFTREIEQLGGRITQIEAQIQALRAQRDALSTQMDLVGAELVRRQDLLSRGAGTQEPVVRLQQELAQFHGRIGELDANQAEAAQRIIETELAILQLATDRREQAISELRDIRVSEQEIMERVDELSGRIAGMDLRAPVTGRIHGLTIFGAGSVLRPADPLAYLVPEGRPLVISARIPAIDIDQLYLGQDAILVFAAFDRNALPEISGQVTQVSADAFVDEMSGTSFYQVEITLPENQAALLGDRTLVPGMPVEVYIQTEARTPLAYLLEPFAAYFGRALRES